LTNEELVLKYQNGCKETLDELIKKNKNLVKYFANRYEKYTGSVLSVDDLEQEGWMAFIEAVNKFSLRENNVNNFSAWAGSFIIKRLLNYINSNANRINKKYCPDKNVNVISLSTPILNSGKKEVLMSDVISDEKAEEAFINVDRKIYLETLRHDIFILLDTVFDENDIRKALIIRYYCLNDEPIISHSKLGLQYGVGEARIQSLIFDGIYTIRKSEAGRAFMMKYQDEYVDYLETEKNSINQYSSPEDILCRMEIIDNFFNNLLS